jgi:hypothetical protein
VVVGKDGFVDAEGGEDSGFAKGIDLFHGEGQASHRENIAAIADRNRAIPNHSGSPGEGVAIVKIGFQRDAEDCA